MSILLLETPSAVGDPLRPFAAGDILRVSTFSSVQFSPNGRTAAIIVQRPLMGERWRSGFVPGSFRGDLYLASATRTLQRLSDGSRSGTDYEDPQFSPDGRFIACRTYSHNGTVRIAVFDTLDRIWHEAPFQTDFVWYMPFFAWDEKDEIIAGGVPLSHPFGRDEFSRIETEARMLPGLLSGDEPTGVVYSSESRDAGFVRNGATLRWNPVTGQAQKIFGGYMTDTALSPNGRWLAAAAPDGLTSYDAHAPVTAMDRRNFEVYLIDTRTGYHWATGLQVDYRDGVLRWDRTSTEVATVARRELSMSGQAYIFRCNVTERHCARVSAKGVDTRAVIPTHMANGDYPTGYTDFLYDGSDRLLIYAPREGGRWEWWVLDGETATAATAPMTRVPPMIVYDRTTGTVVAVADRALWVLRRDARIFKHVRSFEQEVTLLPAASQTGPPVVQGAVALAMAGTPGYTRVDLVSLAETRIAPPSAAARLDARSDSQTESAWLAKDSTGEHLWLVSRNSPPKLVGNLDGFLSQRTLPTCSVFHYRGASGRSLVGVVSRPAAVHGPLPAIVWVYDGSVVSEPQPGSMSCGVFENDPTSANPFNLTVFASRGYAVLYPSMPVRITNGKLTRYPYDELLDGVLPAIKKAASLGYIDPKRLVVMGQSLGGFSTLGIIAQTRLFRAAIACAGLSDWFLEYGVFNPADEPNPSEVLADSTNLGFQEEGDLNAGGPPWAVPRVYERNSPLLHLGAVRTPLLLIDGSEDFVGDQNSEQVFSGLLRLQRRVEFVQYVGQGHVLDSAVDILDFWHRILVWCDKYLS